MEFKIETGGLRFVLADPPEQRVDFKTRAPRTTKDGAPLFQVRLLAMDGAGSAPIRVGVVGDPGVGQGVFVVPVGLRLHAIDRKGESVTWWTAERLDIADGNTPATPASPASAAAGGSGSGGHVVPGGGRGKGVSQ